MDITIHIPTLPFPPIFIPIGIVVAMNLALAWRTWIGNKRHPTNIFFALTALMAALWTFASIVFHITVLTPLLTGILARIAYIAPILIAFFFFLFSCHLGYQIFPLKRWHVRALIISALIMSVIIILPNVFLAWPVPPDRYLKPEISVFWHVVFAIYFTTVMLLAFYVLFIKSIKMDGFWKKRAKQCFIATIVAFIGGSAFNLWFALIRDDSLTWVGPIFTVFMAIYIWYHIFWVPGRIPESCRQRR
ncbi:MAG: hypothetical protein A2249_02815 [Candidatus Jacksonbacteria bacterium RIFOXYA2_FULL_44_7]|uniref:Uncharacterized protein n=1 Tax=Candidatus Jacksonbacteria bacterium RIFCSPLOWO2_02_FULL_44_20 TaxID=1798460 RepID=A0A1G2AA83_9BACT|nr:MAG: hypothetical protein UW39_C0021G0012 [Parcubacteria group bacterium GW2011_GWC2_44_17]KKT48593.1 MAG: hypothetical protein UW40_C0038G0015 [Parcubacteria group bacterium GW2011_GWF2_44_17]OGY72030.1 MAG: hypothetical protein A3C00_03460 [Candidatus Jacksonbacteria bacterium RIFCSPHIGHO2_02_FULL_44_25]OGY73312.1 MAG: hypothetical protein A3H07_01515 [Candidatus Jacksonbacteria bacterium RIFCSPLOWO2_12_FULL_44_15b]OGY73732.1 MAG: hypothetical protein A3H61_00055 [Candidatus Jacksonbacteri